MRRIVFFLAVLSALAAPLAALAAKATPGDGTLVVKNGNAPDSGPDKTPVVRLTITGSVIGQVTGLGRMIIDPGATSPNPDVTGAIGHDVPQSDTATEWKGGGDGFKFRAVGGTYTLVIYTGPNSTVSLVAVGVGSVYLAGTPDKGIGDGKYSVNGADFKSMPGTPTDKLFIESDS